MGGYAVRHEPVTLDALRRCPEVYRIFEDAGWVAYFERLDGFDSDISLEFTHNLTGTHSHVRGLEISVTEAVISSVTGLPRTGRKWFGRRTTIPNAKTNFLEEGEQVQPRGRGTTIESLPQPWDQVVVFLKKYITCEGRYKVVYTYDFVLLSHLRHGSLINMPYYLLESLHNMAHYVRQSCFPQGSVTHHCLIKLIVLRALELQNQTWAQFIARGAVEVDENDGNESEEEAGSSDRSISDREREEREGINEELGQDNVVGELGQGSGDVEMRDSPGVVIAEDVHMEDIGVQMEEYLHQNPEKSPTIIAEENEQLIEENEPSEHKGGDTEKELSVEEPMEEMREGSDT
jgi:hypothetical protein